MKNTRIQTKLKKLSYEWKMSDETQRLYADVIAAMDKYYYNDERYSFHDAFMLGMDGLGLDHLIQKSCYGANGRIKNKINRKYNFGSEATVFANTDYIVKLNPCICDTLQEAESAAPVVPTLFLSFFERGAKYNYDQNTIFIQPRVSFQRTPKHIKIMKTLSYDLADFHDWNWGIWNDIPVLFDW